MRVLRTLLAVSLSAFAAEAPALQPAPTRAQQSFDPGAAIAQVRRIIAERYVLPERRPPLDAVLAEGLLSGRYSVATPAEFAERVNADLARVGRDRHLNFRYDPAAAATFAAATNQAAPDTSAYERQARARNHSVAELKVLPGNIRYMNYTGFDWIGAESATALQSAMRFLSGGDAIIIDLRENGGGSPMAVQYLISHFLEPNRPLVTFYMNGEPSPDRLATLADVPAGRVLGRPLYVLTGDGTGSAAEEFTGHVGGYRIGELVGETTAGAGFRNQLLAVGDFVFSVSVGRAVLASTGRDWEATGHAPSIPSPVAEALRVAQGHALNRLAANATGSNRTRLAALAEMLAATAEPRRTALPLSAYAGAYGERTISVEGDRLFYQLGTRPRTPLIPLGGDRFALENSATATQILFTNSNGAAGAFELGPPSGPVQGRYERTR